MLPMGGMGSRLGLPFPKPLAPTFIGDDILPLYHHAYTRLRVGGADEVFFILSNEQLLDPSLATLPGRRVYQPRGYASSIAATAATLPDETLVLFALPDTIWYPTDAFARLRTLYQRTAGVMGLFPGSSHLLDRVFTGEGVVKEIRYHDIDALKSEQIWGWGCFISAAWVLAELQGSGPIGPQLGRYHFAYHRLCGPYYDLGTPERYRAHHIIEPLKDLDPGVQHAYSPYP